MPASHEAPRQGQCYCYVKEAILTGSPLLRSRLWAKINGRMMRGHGADGMGLPAGVARMAVALSSYVTNRGVACAAFKVVALLQPLLTMLRGTTATRKSFGMGHCSHSASFITMPPSKPKNIAVSRPQLALMDGPSIRSIRRTAEPGGWVQGLEAHRPYTGVIPSFAES